MGIVGGEISRRVVSKGIDEMEAEAEALNEAAERVEADVHRGSVEALKHSRPNVFIEPDTGRMSHHPFGALAAGSVPLGMEYPGMVRIASVIEDVARRAARRDMEKEAIGFGTKAGIAAGLGLAGAGAAGVGSAEALEKANKSRMKVLSRNQQLVPQVKFAEVIVDISKEAGIGSMLTGLGKGIAGAATSAGKTIASGASKTKPWHIAAGLGTAAAGYGAYRAGKAGINTVMKAPPRYSYNVGAYQVPTGVSQYGYTQAAPLRY
jgi:hypothetical protein